jgi:hypothetical protein
MRITHLACTLSLLLAACATTRAADAVDEPSPPAVVERSLKPATPLESAKKKSEAAKIPARRPEGAYARRARWGRRPTVACSVVVFLPEANGWTIPELFETVGRQTGRSILFDPANRQIKTHKVVLVGPRSIHHSQIFEWLQGVLHVRGLTLVPNGPRGADGERQWICVDQADPALEASGDFVPEDELPLHAHRDGVLISTALTVSPSLDVSRIRTALSQLSTRTAGIGRVMDVKGSGAIFARDYAPIVARMRRLLDEMEIAAWEHTAGR